MNEDVVAVLDEWTRAIEGSDVEAASRVLADDFVLTSAGGVAPRVQRQAWLDALAKIETTSFEISVVETRVFGELAVVASHATWRAYLRERDLSGTYALTDVFTRRDGAWQVSWRVSTRLADDTA
ncbi:MAG: nuclear transport factor 2 family protein [Actinomycetota bacterium]|nr:nuclear transport factor 2 family protein [Actinomycetota bacterium]